MQLTPSVWPPVIVLPSSSLRVTAVKTWPLAANTTLREIDMAEQTGGWPKPISKYIEIPRTASGVVKGKRCGVVAWPHGA